MNTVCAWHRVGAQKWRVNEIQLGLRPRKKSTKPAGRFHHSVCVHFLCLNDLQLYEVVRI